MVAAIMIMLALASKRPYRERCGASVALVVPDTRPARAGDRRVDPSIKMMHGLSACAVNNRAAGAPTPTKSLQSPSRDAERTWGIPQPRRGRAASAGSGGPKTGRFGIPRRGAGTSGGLENSLISELLDGLVRARKSAKVPWGVLVMRWRGSCRSSSPVALLMRSSREEE